MILIEGIMVSLAKIVSFWALIKLNSNKITTTNSFFSLSFLMEIKVVIILQH